VTGGLVRRVHLAVSGEQQPISAARPKADAIVFVSARRRREAATPTEEAR
jgi:hypothetical protein